jgi:hypothetical protein
MESYARVVVIKIGEAVAYFKLYAGVALGYRLDDRGLSPGRGWEF